MLSTAIDIETGNVLMLETSGSDSGGGSIPDSTLNNIVNHISALETATGELETAQATLQNDLGDLGDQVQAQQADINLLKQESTEAAADISALEADKIDKNQGTANSGKYLYIGTDGIVTPKTIPTSGGGSSVSDKYGIEADYALHYGILDCPNGLIDYSINSKEIEIQPGVVLQAAGTDLKTTIASATTYEIEETGKITLFFTRTESEAGTVQVGFLEAGDVYYQEEEPEDGVTSFLAWWKPSKGKWQFKSAYTGNVWREAVATPIADINAGATGITSISYIGYRIIDDDIFVQQSDIESINETISTINTSVSTLDTQVSGLYTQVSENTTKLTSCVTGTGVSKMVKISQADYEALETKDETTFYVIVG